MKTTLDLSVLSDKENHKGDIAISWKQNDRKMLDLTMREGGDEASGINIIDHAAEPMQQSVIVVRQLIQYVLGLANGFQQQGQQQGE